VAEHALSAICNLAAGSNLIKGHLADSGVIPVLLQQLAPQADASLAQLAALALRNLSRHTLCKRQIVDSGGVPVLIAFLSEGLEVLKFPLRCEVRSMSSHVLHKCQSPILTIVIRRTRTLPARACCTCMQITYKTGDLAASSMAMPGLMAVDVDRGQLILAPEAAASCCSVPPKETPNLHTCACLRNHMHAHDAGYTYAFYLQPLAPLQAMHELHTGMHRCTVFARRELAAWC
jgi:Armadillo/beta-catenin-like repeat